MFRPTFSRLKYFRNLRHELATSASTSSSLSWFCPSSMASSSSRKLCRLASLFSTSSSVLPCRSVCNPASSVIAICASPSRLRSSGASPLIVIGGRSFSRSSFDFAKSSDEDDDVRDKNRNNDSSGHQVDEEQPLVDDEEQTAQAEPGTSIDEESLLAEYYRSYKEAIWTADKDDDRDVRWMEMLGNRGVEGVFDIEELVDVLKAENVQDIVCVRVPDEINYADYLLIGTGFSFRHLNSVAEYVKKLHKGKKWRKDPHAVIEGVDAEDWLVMDLGNIVLHLFQPSARAEWDLEMLWAVGPEFDEKTIEGRRSNVDLASLTFVGEEDAWDLDAKLR